MTSKEIDTDGGAYIEGEVKTDGGDFIGHDKNVITDTQGNVHIGDIIYQKTKVEEFREALEKRISQHFIDLTIRFQKAERNKPDEPYRHLSFFDLEHKNIFFGRDGALRDLVSLICAENHNSRLTLIHAPSGAGKTSLLRIMQPELQKQGTLPLYIFHPQEPVRTIKQTIFPDPPHPDILNNLPLRTFLSWASDPLRKNELYLILILDQFEEFFIQLAESQRQTFFSSLRECYWAENLRVKFIISIRGDYLGYCLSDIAQVDRAILSNQFPLLPLTRDQAKEAIEGPVQTMPVKWEEASIERLLNYLEQGEMEPPQLQLICATRYKQLYLEENKTELTVSEKDLQSIYSDFLSKVMDVSDDDPRFNKNQRELGWRLLKQYLITSNNTKISVPLSQLYVKVAPKPELEPVVRYLVDERILRRDTDAYGQAIIEITHDTLAKEIAKRETKHEQSEKIAWELVNKELDVWLYHKKSSQYLMSESTLKTLNSYREYLTQPSSEMLHFLFRSALSVDFEVEYWYERSLAGGVNVESILLDRIHSEKFQERLTAVTLLAQLEGDYLDLLQNLLKDEYPQIRKAAILQLEQSYPNGEWRKSLVFERYIPAGYMEYQQENVYLDAFYVSRYPVTNADYKQYMDDVGKDFDIPQGKDNYPVVNINLEKAKAYAEWADMRLLNETEWEKAASWDEFSSDGDSKKRSFPWGDSFNPELCNTVLMHENTTPVGSFSKKGGDSAYGVADLAGNVWEWTSSQFTLSSLSNNIVLDNIVNITGLSFSESGPYQDGDVPFSHHLFGLISQSFSNYEFQELCEELGVNYAKLPGRSLLCKINELIKRFRKNNNLHELMVVLEEKRPYLFEESEDNEWEILTNLDLKTDTLHWILVNFFSEDELLDLCFDFFPNYDYLLTTSNTERASELLSYLGYYGWLNHLDDALKKLRPKVMYKFESSGGEKVTFTHSKPSLKKVIYENFLPEEIEVLWNRLEIPYKIISPLRAISIIRIKEIIFYLERRDLLDELRIYLKSERNFIDWDDHFGILSPESQHLDKMDIFIINVSHPKYTDILTLIGKVRALLIKHLTNGDNELEDIVLAMNLNWDNLSGNSYTAKTRELIQRCEKNGKSPYLVKEIYRADSSLFAGIEDFASLLQSLWEQNLLATIFQNYYSYDESKEISLSLSIDFNHIYGNTLEDKVKSLLHQMYCTKSLFTLAQLLVKYRPNILLGGLPDEIQYFLNFLPQSTIRTIIAHNVFTVRGGSFRSFISATSCDSKSSMMQDRKADNLGFRVGFGVKQKTNTRLYTAKRIKTQL